MCYYMHNCIRVTVVKRLNIEAFWFFCAVLLLQKVGQTIGITSSAQLWQYVKYSQFRFLQLYYTAKQLSCQPFCFLQIKLSAKRLPFFSGSNIVILVSREGAQRQRMSPCRCTFIGVESWGCQIKYTMRLNGGSCLPCTKIIAQNAASENRKCKNVQKCRFSTYWTSYIYSLQKSKMLQFFWKFFCIFLRVSDSLGGRSALPHFYQKPQIRKHIFPCYCPLAQTVV